MPRCRWKLGLGCLLGLALAFPGCSSSRTQSCADGRVCPSAQICDLAHAACTEQQHQDACVNRVDGEECFSHGARATCDEGFCMLDVCGDGLQGVSEICDDGNADPGDGCAGDCSSDESCGNGIVDLEEQCDCGDSSDSENPSCSERNSNTAGAVCRADCVLHCGDGVINDAEDCDTQPPGILCTELGFDFGALYCGRECRNSTAPCGRIGFRKRQSLPPINVLTVGGYTGLAGTSKDQIWVSATQSYLLDNGGGVTEAHQGVVFHFNGITWSSTAPNVGDSQLLDIATDGPNRVAVGCQEVSCGAACLRCNAGQIVHNQDSNWTIHTTSERTVRSVIAVGPDDFIAVGNAQIHRGGSTGYALAHTVAGAGLLAGAGASGPNDIFVVGANASNGLAVHFDGSSWTNVSSGLSGRPLVSVTVTGDSVVAVGPGGAAVVYDRTLKEWVEENSHTDTDLHSATSGEGFALAVSGGMTLLRQSSGWSQISDGIPSAIFDTARFGDETWVGAGTQLYQFTGNAESAVHPSTFVTGTDRRAWRSSDGVLFLSAGAQVTIHDDGAVTQSTSLGPILSLWGRSSTDVYAVGGGGFQRFDGTDWTEPCIGLGAYNSIIGNATEVYFVGPSGKAYVFDGTTCESLAFPDPTAILRSIWGTTRSNLYVATAYEKVFHFDGTNWTELPSPEFEGYSLWSDGGDLWLGGAGGAIAVFRDGQWQRVASYIAGRVDVLTGLGPKDIWAGTIGGELAHWDGNSWSPVPVSLAQIDAIVPTADRIIVVDVDWVEILRTSPWWQAP